MEKPYKSLKEGRGSVPLSSFTEYAQKLPMGIEPSSCPFSMLLIWT